MDLPFRATTAEACDWLAAQTGAPWTLARLIEHAVTPYVWLDYDASRAELFGDANGGYAAPIFFKGDTQRLAAGSEDVLITMTKDAYRIVVQLPPPGIRRALHELRFQKHDLTRLVAQLKKAAEAPPPAAKVARESTNGINQEQVLLAFAGMVKFDLAQALAEAGGLFGDEGARVKGSARKSKKHAVWNPVTLALGLCDVYRVPQSRLKRAFMAHDFLLEWAPEWEQSVELLSMHGKR
ncbi:MAG: hypothetical protein ACEQSK_13535 [Sphingomonadaceae bacterium]